VTCVTGIGSQDDPAGSPQAPAQQVVAGYLGKHAQALAALDPKVRAFEPDAVHQMRVASRRLRAALRTFGSVIGGAETERLAAELRWLGGVLGVARDAEVQADRMTERLRLAGAEGRSRPSSGGQRPLDAAASRIRSHFAAASATDDVIAALDSQRYRDLLTMLDHMLAEPPLGPHARAAAELVLPAAVRRSHRKVWRRMRRAGRLPAGQELDMALHQARKAAKQARYAAEAAEPVFGGDARRFARKMAKMQSVLGEHQDAVVGRELARELGAQAERAGESAFWYGVWFAGEDELAGRLQPRAWRTWRKASRRRHRRWLDANRDGLDRPTAGCG
jgi:CHAD domain-containing protein